VWSHFLEASIAQATTAAAKTIIAVSSTVSDISSLEKQVAGLNRSIAGWNRAYVWALGIALLVGAFSFWAQRQATSRSRDLVRVSSELSEEKDRELKRDLKEKDVQIGQTKERAEKLEKETAEAKRRQAEAEKQLLEIQQRFKPRTLIGEQRDTFLKNLKDAPRGKVEVSVTTGDTEAYTFAAQLWNTLKDAGFDVGPQLGSFTLFGPPPVGVIFGIKDKDNEPRYGRPIQRALEAATGILADGRTPFGSEVDVLYIQVGIKPVE